jgi:hypothetical protein
MRFAECRRALQAVAAAACLLPVALAQNQGSGGGAAQHNTSPIAGDWRGDSPCVAKNTACRDETVVYHIANIPDKPGYVAVNADKIVNGRAINMGILEFRYDATGHVLTCQYSQGVWRLKVDGDTIEGTLTVPDGAVLRRVMLRKQR